MSRSQYIYVVQEKDCITPIAAFTVKHELESWLGKTGRYGDPGVLVWRIRDSDQTITRIG